MSREEADELTAELVLVYQRAWAEIAAELESIATDPGRWARRGRLRALQRQVDASMAYLDQRAYMFVSQDFARIYALGSVEARAEIEAPKAFVWSQSNATVVKALGTELYDGLLAATEHTSQSTKVLVRELSRTQVLDKLAQGQTATDAGRQLQRKLEAKKVNAITYANGAKHNVADYAEMLLRTQTTKAYNSGALSTGDELGFDYVELRDGADCGMRSHSDPVKANGKIMRRSEVVLLSHPRCRRSVLLRPDVANEDQARSATSLVTPEQDRAQAEADLRRQQLLEQRRRQREQRRRRTRRREVA